MNEFKTFIRILRLLLIIRKHTNVSFTLPDSRDELYIMIIVRKKTVYLTLNNNNSAEITKKLKDIWRKVTVIY